MATSTVSGNPARDLGGPRNRLAVQLAVPAREWFLADAVRIGLADGPLSDEERQAAQEIAAQLGMTPAQARGVISMTEEGAAAQLPRPRGPPGPPRPPRPPRPP